MSNYTIDPKTIEIAAKKHEAAAKNRETIKSERKANRHAAEQWVFGITGEMLSKANPATRFIVSVR